MKKQPKVIISGGGTGGHIFPALSIADAMRAKHPDAEILFVGAENRMEMERIPEAGYKIVGLPIAGFDRKNLCKNIFVLWKLYKSLSKARKIIKDFQPDVAIGVGGYASGPLLKAASQKNIATLLQEQNSYAGVTNKWLARKATTICVAYDGMEQFFPKNKIVLTGNPVRKNLTVATTRKEEAYRYFGLNPGKKTILVVGGSLGARTINESILTHLKEIANSDVQFIWQTGKYYYKEITGRYELKLQSDPGKTDATQSPDSLRNIHVAEFIPRMDLAYSIADLIISRAGAGSISEFCLLGKPVILVPSPNVAEDHQTKNAQALAQKDAAILIPDSDAVKQLITEALKTVQDDARLKALSTNILKLALPDAADKIVEEIEKIIPE
jgi:UDP-N-acetylglucosamine--N-acetylmuramyl-(pentapeptide) pyrophosphoryl-undecaprenol N-acetylglucosamine transferase